MKNALLFLAKLLAWSILLYLGRDAISIAYQAMLYVGVYPILHLVQGMPYESSLRLIPFLALILATPRLSLKRRLAVLGIGVGTFLFLDLLSTYIWHNPPSRTSLSGSSPHILYSLVWELLGHWLLPLGMWIIAAKEEIGTLLGGFLKRHAQVISGAATHRS